MMASDAPPPRPSDTPGFSEWSEAARRLHAYWRTIHLAKGLPGRQHLDPTAIPDLLSRIWLLDVQHEPFRLRCRLAGTEIVRAIGREVTGLWLDEAHPHIDYAAPQLLRYHQVVRDGQASWYKGQPYFWTHRDFATIENLLLPLAGDGRRVDILVAFTVLHRAVEERWPPSLLP